MNEKWENTAGAWGKFSYPFKIKMMVAPRGSQGFESSIRYLHPPALNQAEYAEKPGGFPLTFIGDISRINLPPQIIAPGYCPNITVSIINSECWACEKFIFFRQIDRTGAASISKKGGNDISIPNAFRND